MTNKISLLISDENRLFREGLGKIIINKKMEIAGEVRSLVEALDLLRAGGSDANLLLCDPATDPQREFDAMKEIAREFPGIKILVLTDRSATLWLDMAVEAGASGFLPKDISVDALGFSLSLVLLGEQIFPTLQSLLEPKPHAPAAPISVSNGGQSRPTVLSAREADILRCLVEGQPNKTIARSLNMAEATVKVHLKALLHKIHARNRTQAAIWGMNYASKPSSIPPPAFTLADSNSQSSMSGV